MSRYIVFTVGINRGETLTIFFPLCSVPVMKAVWCSEIAKYFTNNNIKFLHNAVCVKARQLSSSAAEHGYAVGYCHRPLMSNLSGPLSSSV